MFGLWKTHKRYTSARAFFKLGNLKSDDYEEVGLSLCTSELGAGLLSFTRDQFVCELSKRATVMALKKSPELDPAVISVELIRIDLIA